MSRSSEPLQRWKREAVETKRKQEQAQAEMKAHEQAMSTKRIQADASWNAWLAAGVKAARAAEPFTKLQVDVLGAVVAEVRQQMRDHVAEQIGLLRAELTIAKANERGRDPRPPCAPAAEEIRCRLSCAEGWLARHHAPRRPRPPPSS